MKKVEIKYSIRYHDNAIKYDEWGFIKLRHKCTYVGVHGFYYKL